MFKIFTFILLFISSPIFAKDKCVNLGICAIFQNEAPYLEEWIEFHKKQGFKKFYLFNNLSVDDYKIVLQEYVEDGLVELIEWPYASDNQPAWNTIQCDAYNHGLALAKGKVKWCAFIDTDEFLFSPTHKSIKETLKEYKSYSGVCVSWVCYGTSDISTRQLVKNLVHRSHFNHPMNKYCKSIINVEKASHCVDPHFFFYHQGYAVTEQYVRQHGSVAETHSVQKLRINHYWSRDLDFFWNNKIPRHLKWSSNYDELVQREKDFNLVYDPILANMCR